MSKTRRYFAGYSDRIEIISVGGKPIGGYKDDYGNKGGEWYNAEQVDNLLEALKILIKELSNENKELKKQLEQKEAACIKRKDALRGSKTKKLNSVERKVVYDMVKDGVRYTQISKQFGISRNTIKAYVKEFESVSENVNLRFLTGDENITLSALDSSEVFNN